MCSMITLRTVLGPPCMSWPFVKGVAGVEAGVPEFCVPSAWAACRAACAEAFWNKIGHIKQLKLSRLYKLSQKTSTKQKQVIGQANPQYLNYLDKTCIARPILSDLRISYIPIYSCLCQRQLGRLFPATTWSSFNQRLLVFVINKRSSTEFRLY